MLNIDPHCSSMSKYCLLNHSSFLCELSILMKKHERTEPSFLLYLCNVILLFLCCDFFLLFFTISGQILLLQGGKKLSKKEEREEKKLFFPKAVIYHESG